MSEASGVAPVQTAKPEDRWLVLIGALKIQLILGVVYGFSALVQPLQEAFGWSNRDIQMANSLALFFFAAAMVPAGRLQDKYGPRLPAMIGAEVLFVAFLLASTIRTPDQKVIWWLSYGVLYGIGIGFAYVCPIAALAKWFPDIKGLITGIAVAGFGAGAAVFVPTVSQYLAQNELSDFFLTHAMICGLVVAIGALLLKNPPAAPRAAGAAAPVETTWRDVLKTTQFWLLWGMFVGSATAGLMTISIIKPAVSEFHPAHGATAVGIFALMNAVGRVFWGAVSDRTGREAAMFIMFVAQAASMFCLTFMLQASPYTAFLLMGLIGLNFGGNFALFPAATADTFGTAGLGVNYGMVFTAYGIAGIVGPQLAAWYKDAGQGYNSAYIIAAVMVGAAAVAAAFAKKILQAKQ